MKVRQQRLQANRTTLIVYVKQTSHFGQLGFMPKYGNITLFQCLSLLFRRPSFLWALLFKRLFYRLLPILVYLYPLRLRPRTLLGFLGSLHRSTVFLRKLGLPRECGRHRPDDDGYTGTRTHTGSGAGVLC